jgi:hypothetical protein
MIWPAHFRKRKMRKVPVGMPWALNIENKIETEVPNILLNLRKKGNLFSGKLSQNEKY